MTLTRSRTIQYIGILFSLLLIAGGYWYFAVRAGVKTNTSGSQPQGTGDLSAGLAGYWKLDENTGTSAGDASTNGNAGTLTNGPTWTTGQIGTAVDFDGTNDYIDLGTSAVLDLGNRHTVSAWINPDTLPGDGTDVQIFSQGAANCCGLEYGLALRKGGGQDYIRFNHEASGNALNYQIALATGTWHHLVGTWDGATMRLYLNGTEVANVAQSGTISEYNNTAFIGKAETGGYFDGKIDEVRVYDRSLSSDEVANLYRLTTPTAVDTSLKGYWSLDGGALSGTTAYDRSGAGNTGTLTNGPTVTEGRVGQALNFAAASTQYVDVGDMPSLEGQSALTVSGWVYRTSNQSYGPMLSKYSSSTSDTTLQQGEDGGIGYYAGLIATVRNGSDAYGYTSDNKIPLNTWSHVSMVFDGSLSGNANRLKVYVNGIQETLTFSGTIPATTASNAQNFLIGRAGGAGNYWDGKLDEVRVYSRVLSAAEIKSLYDRGTPDKSNTSAAQPGGTGNLNSGLTGYWKLDENTGTSAADASTNGSTGTLTNGPTWTTGQIGSGVNLDGTNDYIVTTSVPGVVDQTVSVWIKPDVVTGNRDIVMQQYGDVRLVTQGDEIRWSWGGGNDYHDTAAANLTAGQWYHIVVTYYQSTTDGNVHIYINGADQALLDNGEPISPSGTAGTVTIGGSTTDFDGTVDEVRIYDRALSADEVANIYRLTAPTGVDTSLKGYWSFNGDTVSGTTAYDRSGAGNNGTLTNGPTIKWGRVGQSLSFDGSNDYVDAGSATVIDDLTQKTVCHWIYPETIPASFIQTVSKGSSGSGWYLELTNTDGNNRFEYFQEQTGVNGSWKTPVDSVPFNTWSHVCVSHDRSSLTNDPVMYINGLPANVEEMTTPTGTYSSDAADPLRIGAWNGAGELFDGKIDEVRIYNRLVSASEVKSQYDLGAPDKTNTSVSTPQGTGRLDSGLVGYWKLDDGSGTNATDSSINGNTGTLTGGPTWTTGQIGGAIDLDGTDDKVVMTGSAALNTAVFTLSAWVNPDSVIAGYRTYLSKGTAASNANFYLEMNNDEFGAGFHDGSIWREHETIGFNASTGQWYHTVATYDGSRFKIYVNGAQVLDEAETAVPVTTDTQITLGNQGSADFGGLVDEVRIYDRPLSADEVGQLYRLGVPTGTDTSLKGYWSFNGQDISGTTAYDRSGAGNDGTLTNGPTVKWGKLGQALNLDGTNDYVALPSNMSILQNTATATLVGWYRLTSLNATEHEILAISKNNGGTPTSESRATTAIDSAGKFYCGGRSADADTFQSVVTVNNAPVGTWTHYVCTINYTTDAIAIYLNGELQTTTGTPNFSAATTANTVSTGGAIGAEDDGGTYFFNGLLDEQRVYNRLLSASEIQALYSSGK